MSQFFTKGGQSIGVSALASEKTSGSRKTETVSGGERVFIGEDGGKE